MNDYRKIIVVLLIAVLFTFFVQATIDAFKQSPNYADYCNIEYPNRMDLSEEEWEEQRRQLDEEREECMQEYRNAQDDYNSLVFIISVIAAGIAIIAGLYLPVNTSAGMTVTTGLLLGGLLTLFIGTIRGWSAISEITRPLILLAELALIIVLSYKFFK